MSNDKTLIELKNNQLAVNKRINKRKIEGLKRVGRIVLNGTIGFTGIGVANIFCKNIVWTI